jgi:integrase
MSKAKQIIDRLMGDAPPWVFHDTRRTARSRLSTLNIPEHVCELVLGHGRKGLGRIYDQHRYEDEKRKALEAWADLLRTIVEPTPTEPSNNVLPMKQRA